MITLRDRYLLHRGTSGHRQLSLEAARELLRRVGDARTLRYALATFGVPGVHRLGDAAVIERLAQMIAWGSLSLEREVAPHMDVAPRIEAEEPEYESEEEESPRDPEPEPTKKKTWITIALAREDDVPIANQRYRIELPDGSVREGSLDAAGQVHLEDIDPGQCQVTFPGL